MEKKIALSFCIATLNRAAFIRTTLDSIITQADEDIEIVIVDGASTDNTEEIVKHYQQKFPGLIRYHRLPVKGGIDQDYCRAVELATGDYCWLFTDDDILKPGAIQAVLSAIRHQHDLILVNAEIRNVDFSDLLKERYLQIEKDRFYGREQFEELFIDVADYLSFIGGVVIKKSLWDQRAKTAYFGTAFVHVGVIFQAPIVHGVIVLAEPYISIRYGNASWSAMSFEISLFRWPNLIWSFAHFSEAARRQVQLYEPWRSIKVLVVCRARGVYSRNEYNAYVKPRLKKPAERFVLWSLSQFPGFILNTVLYLYLFVVRFHHARSKTLQADLQQSGFFYKNYLGNILNHFRFKHIYNRFFGKGEGEACI